MTKASLLILFLTTVSLLAGETWPPFKLPPEARPITTDPSNKTWNMTGKMDLQLDKATNSFRKYIEAENFVFLHEIILDQKTGKKLLAWKKGRERLILFLWKADGNTTGFSWGLATE